MRGRLYVPTLALVLAAATCCAADGIRLPVAPVAPQPSPAPAPQVISTLAGDQWYVSGVMECL